MRSRSRWLAALVAIFGAAARQAGAREYIDLADEAQRLALVARVEALNADLLTTNSATLTLERWCRDNGMASPAVIHVDRVPPGAAEPSAAQRARLGIEAGERLGYRQVRLQCGAHVLSEASNWYVPGRLTPEMNAALDSTDMPFGKVVLPLGPRRLTLEVTRYPPLVRDPEGGGRDRLPIRVGCGQTIFTHDAMVLDRDGRPLAEVRESYKAELFC